ncbi:MAG: O-antigen ligase family protein, partial [Elusimicrobiota bacterium]|nr:O-antigen ligase family protein [Elusimicrobiota bacterium]
MIDELTKANIVFYSEKAIHWIMGLTVLLLPLVFNPSYIDAFNLPKVALFRFAVLIMFTIWIVKNCISKEFVYKKTELDIPVIVFLCTTVLSTAFSINTFHSIFGQHMYHFDGLLSVVSYVLLYIVVVNTVDTKRLKTLIWVMILSSSITFFYGIMQSLNMDFVNWQISPSERIWSSFGNPNFFAGYLVMIIPLLLGYIAVQFGIKRVLLICILTAALCCLLLTFSRAGFVGVFAAIVIYLYLVSNKKVKIWLKRITVATVLIVGILSTVSIFIQKSDIEAIKPNQNIVTGIFRTLKSIANIEDPNVKARLRYITTALKMFTERPLFGFGPDSFSIVWRKYMTKELSKLTGNRLANPGYVHSEILQVLATQGIIGLVAYVLLIVSILRLSLRVECEAIQHKLSLQSAELFPHILAGIVASIFGIFVNNQVSFHSPTTAVLLWFLISA